MGTKELSREEVEKVSLLARLRLSPGEIDSLTRQLGQIVEYVHVLDEAETTGVEPMAHVADIANVFRGDEPGESLSRDEALANAPKHDGSYFLVPAVLGETT
jgi:aspartyl-tRNA(Asn)/glutamyl-tRNA(Gln) amidotransferase subunit C